MKILVDGEALAHPREDECALWSAILPSLIDALQPHEVYFLSRAGTSPGSCSRLRLLSAPGTAFRISPMEDRRLAALCSELGIEAFLSTYYTSAGANMRSTFVATHSLVHRLEETGMRECIRRSARLASTQVAVSQEIAEAVRRVCNILEAPICVVDPTDAEAFAAAIVESFEVRPGPDVAQIRRVEEEKVSLEAGRMRAMQETAADLRWREESEKRKHPHWIPRIWRAVRNPRRYPEYLTRLERRLVHRSPGDL